MKTASIVAVAGSACLLAVQASANDACSVARHLKSDLPSVLTHPSSFSRHSDQYDFHILSAFGKSPYSESLMCLRYDFVNRSARAIEGLRWPDVGIWFATVAAVGDIRRYRTEATRYATPEIEETELLAFERSKAKARVYLTQEQAIRRDGKKAQFIFEFYTVADGFLKAVDSLRKANISVGELPAVRVPKKKAAYPTLTTEIAIGSDVVHFESWLLYDQGKFSAGSKLYSKSSTKMFSLHAPITAALSNLPSGTLDEGYLYTFAESLPKLSQAALRTEGSSHYVGYWFSPPKWDAPAAFVVKQPLSLSTDAGFLCVTVNLYSPAPLSIDGGEYCNRAQK